MITAAMGGNKWKYRILGCFKPNPHFDSSFLIPALILLLLSIALLLALIIFVRLNAFIALIITTLFVGLAKGMPAFRGGQVVAEWHRQHLGRIGNGAGIRYYPRQYSG